MKQILTFMLVALSSHLFPQNIDTIYTMFPFQWGGLSFNENDTKNKISIDEINSIFIKKKGTLKQDIRYLENPKSLYKMLERKKKNNAVYDIYLVPYLMRDFGFTTCRLYAYDAVKNGVIWNDMFAGQNFSKEKIVDSSIVLFNRMAFSTPLNNTVFDGLIQKGVANFCIEEFQNWNQSDLPIFTPPSLSSKVVVDDIVDAIGDFYAGDLNKIKWFVNVKRQRGDSKAKKSLEKISEEYPKVWRILDAIEFFENIKNSPIGRPKDDQIKILKGRIKKIETDLEEFTDEEFGILKKHNIDSIASILCKSFDLVYRCKELKDKADEKKFSGQKVQASAIYLSILRTPNITPMMEEIKGVKRDCKVFKEEAYNSFEKLYLDNRDKYQKLLHESEKTTTFNDKSLKIKSAHLIDNNISLYGVDTILYIKNKNKSKNDPITDIARKESAMQHVENTFGTLVNNPMSIDFANTTLNFKKIGKSITIEIIPATDNDPSWKGWFSETKYRPGIYSSSNDDEISKKIVSAISEVNQRFPGSIESVKFDLTGSADITGFRSDGPLRLQHPQYGNIVDTVHECKQPGENCERFMPLKELIKGINKEYICPDGKTNNPFFKNSSKNLALAYLRAYHRKEIMTNTLKSILPTIKTSHTICANLANGKGDHHRYVNMKITIQFK